MRAARIEKIILQLSSSLINVSPKSLAAEIERGLQPLLYEFEVDRFKLYEIPQTATRSLVLAASGTAPGMPLGVKDLDLAPYQAAVGMLASGRQLLVSRVDELGPDFQALRELAESEGIRSFAIFPLHSVADLIGILTFTSLYKQVVWTEEMQRGLQMAASIIGQALAHRRTEAHRREIESRLKAIHDAAPIGLEQVSPEGRFMMVNPTFCEIVGYSADELLTMHYGQITHPEDREAELRHIDRMLAGDCDMYQLDKRYIRKNGSEVWVMLSSAAVRDETGHPAYRVSVCQDITARKTAEEALRESESRIRLAMQVGRMYAFEWDLSLDVISRSISSVEILGLTKRRNWDTRASFLERIHPEDRKFFSDLPQALSPGSKTYQKIYRIFRPDGRTIWIEENGRGDFHEDGRLRHIVGIAADVTARHEEELAHREWASQLVHSQEQDRARIARELHDDIGQRLALLAVRLDSLQLQIQDPASPMKLELADAWRSVHELTVDLQRVSHELHAGKLRYLGLSVALRNLCHEFEQQNRIKAFFSGPSAALSLDEGEELTLYRICQEALRNVAKHSNARSVTLTLAEEIDGVRLVISDDGVGFDPQPANRRGGLGLVSMKERLLTSGGTLSISTAPGKGTVLEVRLPQGTAPAGALSSQTQ